MSEILGHIPMFKILERVPIFEISKRLLFFVPLLLFQTDKESHISANFINNRSQCFK